MRFKEEYKYINTASYVEIFSHPQWYLELREELKEYFYDYKGDKSDKAKEWLEKREEFKKMVCELLNGSQIRFAENGEDLDKERLPIDTIIIHHSSTLSDIPTVYLDALGLLRLYAPIYSSEKSLKYGKPVWSGHFYGEKQIFIGYHYLVRQDGSFEQILEDRYIGWHSGNWDCNKRSIAICFVDDLTDKKPSEEAIKAARGIIRKYSRCNVLGHREVLPTTICPGNLFLEKEGWKNDLL